MSLNLDQALAVLDAAKGERLWPYVAVSVLGGIHRGSPCHALVRVDPEVAVEAPRDPDLTQAAARAKAGTILSIEMKALMNRGNGGD